MELYECIKKCKNKDEDAIIFFINKFKKTIKSYNNKFYDDDIESIIIINLMNAIEKINLDNFNGYEEAKLINYFVKVIKNTYIQELNNFYKRNEKVVLAELNDLDYQNKNLTNYIDFDVDLIFYETINSLSNNEKDILIKYFIYNMTCSEIAKDKNVSRQYIFNVKKNVLLKLKKNIK